MVLKVILGALFIIALVFIFKFSARNNDNSDNNTEISGQSYNLAQGGFSLFFPSQPTFSTSTQDFFGSGNMALDDTYDFSSTDGSIYLAATYANSVFAGLTSSPEENLKSELSHTSLGYNLISSNITEYDGLPAIDYLMYGTTTNMYVSGRDIAKGGDIYMIEYSYPPGKENKQLEQNFFGSLTFSAVAQDSSDKSTVQPQSETQPTQTVPPAKLTSPSVSLSPSLINQIEPTIVEINCWSGENATTVGTAGSGEALMAKGSIVFLSNYHVYAEAYTGTQPPNCYATFPEPPNFSDNPYYGDYQISLLAYKYNPDTYQDEALFVLGAPLTSTSTLDQIPTLTSLPLSGLTSDCSNVEVGDKLTIFGYPASGNALGISETVTQGIVSGIVPGPIYKTDAPIDHGNSGGIAIRDSDSCILGIPTLGVSGLTAGIGYIQSTYLLGEPTTD